MLIFTITNTYCAICVQIVLIILLKNKRKILNKKVCINVKTNIKFDMLMNQIIYDWKR